MSGWVNVKEDQRPWPRVQILSSMMLSLSSTSSRGREQRVCADRERGGGVAQHPHFHGPEETRQGAVHLKRRLSLYCCACRLTRLCFALLCSALLCRPPSTLYARCPAPFLLFILCLRLPTLNTRTAPYASSSLHPTLRHRVCLLHTMPSQRYERVCSPASGRGERIVPLRKPPPTRCSHDTQTNTGLR